MSDSFYLKRRRVDEVPNGVELLTGVAFEDGGDLRLLSVGGEFGHLRVDVEARRVERETLVIILTHSLLRRRIAV